MRRRDEKQRRDFDPELHARCVSKRGYESERIARKRAEQRKFTRPLYPYRCRHCGLWHLTKKRGADVPAR